MNSFGTNLKEARKKSGLTQRQLAEAIGAKHNSVSNWETDQNKPDPDTIGLICGVLGVSPNSLFGSYPDSDNTLFTHPDVMPIKIRRKVPILGKGACGEPIYHPGDGTEYIDISDDFACDFALIAKGDSMSGDRIHDGDVVFFRAQDDVDDGDIAAVELDDGMSIKRIKRLRSADGQILYTQLLSSNTKYDSIDIGGADETRTAHIRGKAVAFKALLNRKTTQREE